MPSVLVRHWWLQWIRWICRRVLMISAGWHLSLPGSNLCLLFSTRSSYATVVGLQSIWMRRLFPNWSPGCQICRPTCLGTSCSAGPLCQLPSVTWTPWGFSSRSSCFSHISTSWTTSSRRNYCVSNRCNGLFLLRRLTTVAEKRPRLYSATLSIARTMPSQDVRLSVSLSVCHTPVFCRNG